MAFLIDDDLRFESIKKKVSQYVQEHTSATETIVERINLS
jgi:hypothetical protein